MTEHWFRVVTKGVDHVGMSYVYRDNKEYCGPFLTRTAALQTLDALEAAQKALKPATE